MGGDEFTRHGNRRLRLCLVMIRLTLFRESISSLSSEHGLFPRLGSRLTRPMGAIDVETPLFVCYANCCRSVLAYYLYRHLHADDPALSAGLYPGERINDRALGMLRHW